MSGLIKFINNYLDIWKCQYVASGKAIEKKVEEITVEINFQVVITD